MPDSSASMEILGRRLITWYNEHHRKLPWRETRDPYRILVSETMLQQTRVETVIPYYHSFLRQFPDLRALAAAPEEMVLKAWQGLGYYRRAKNLQRAADTCVRSYDAQIPNDMTAVQSLPGVGPYTTGAIMSIAFDQPVAAVDGNVLRVVARLLGLTGAIETTAVKTEITKFVQEAVEGSTPSLFTQAVMELGAVVCTPRNAQCLICPLSDRCVAKREGLVDALPNKQPKKKRKQIDVLAFVLEVDGALVIQRRKASGLLANMWQLPSIEYDGYAKLSDKARDQIADASLLQLLFSYPEMDMLRDSVIGERVRETAETAFHRNREDSASLIHFAEVDRQRHIFTHLEWDVHVLRPVGLRLSSQDVGLSPSLRLVPIDSLPELAWPKVYEKVLLHLLNVDVRR